LLTGDAALHGRRDAPEGMVDNSLLSLAVHRF